MMWAIGTIDAIDRLDEAFASKISLRDETPPGTPEGRRVQALSSYFEFNVVWAANHLVTAHGRLGRQTRERIASTSRDMVRVIERLRDVLEHWEKNWGYNQTGAHQRLREVDPGATAWTTQWSRTDGLTLAGSLRVPALRDWANDVLGVCESEFVSLAEEILP